MSENNETEKKQKLEIEQAIETQACGQEEAGIADEFKITVRKLELPVRPRGVLAE